jgi:hypothetical protein
MAYFEPGERAIAVNSAGRGLNFRQFHGSGRGIAAGNCYSRPAPLGSPHGPIFSIKTEVKY